MVIIINGRLHSLMPASLFVRQASFSPDTEEHPDNRPLYRDGTKLMDIRHVRKRLRDNIWRISLLYKSIKVHLMKKKGRFDSD
ncbi:hypothetical protein GMD66_15880 [Parabacteroides merdae]|uniref:Uncharacterized protein n=2 Tax=Parabacteroides merdae TaxID=46503 RepID=A0A7K1HI99_9BACT|nr:hypothetical protein [Parabacteroides merdae]